ncbi:MAG TPA: hypothetical protein DCQ06_08400 [Myxococcales bacterium]|nr:hypothetical protein [Myxococcales bacterium]
MTSVSFASKWIALVATVAVVSLFCGTLWAESVEPNHVVELNMSVTTASAYQDSMRYVRSNDAIGLLTSMRKLARQDPHPLVIGRLVRGCANVAEGPDAHERVDALLQDADQNEDDPLRQLIAGVAVHYRGHHTGKRVDSKKADYRRALHYLGRTQGRFRHAARYWLYTAVSHYRLGSQAQAEEAIAMAVKTDIGSDADVFYSQAEIFHRTEPKRALKHLKQYRQLMKDNHARGGFSAPEKDARVGEMIARVEQAVAGKLVPANERIFDPVKTSHGFPTWLALILAALAGIGVGLGAARWRSSSR